MMRLRLNTMLNINNGFCGGLLGEIQRKATEERIPIIPRDSVAFLESVTELLKPERILEIGCAIGFSAALMLSHMPETGHVITIDRFDIMIADAKRNFKLLGIEKRVTLLEGDALEILTGLDGEFDMIFVDAAKGQYINFLPHCMRLLRGGGVLLCDDVLQGGILSGERLAVPRRQRTTYTRMREFLHSITTMPEMTVSILPIGDGMAFCVKK